MSVGTSPSGSGVRAAALGRCQVGDTAQSHHCCPPPSVPTSYSHASLSLFSVHISCKVPRRWCSLWDAWQWVTIAFLTVVGGEARQQVGRPHPYPCLAQPRPTPGPRHHHYGDNNKLKAKCARCQTGEHHAPPNFAIRPRGGVTGVVTDLGQITAGSDGKKLFMSKHLDRAWQGRLLVWKYIYK